jgi:phosphate/sulfate permease
MVGDQIRCPPQEPGQVTHTQLPSVVQGRGHDDPRRIGERLGRGSGPFGQRHGKEPSAQGLCTRQIETDEVAAFTVHAIILTCVAMAWVLTIPCAGAMAALVYGLLYLAGAR